tara:strand:- start:405 stop:623 length:219 start_codon:yes stop_codon:yes gene_type:complete
MKKIIKLISILPVFIFANSNATIMTDFLQEKEKEILIKSEKSISKEVECSMYKKLELEAETKLLELEKKKEK